MSDFTASTVAGGQEHHRDKRGSVFREITDTLRPEAGTADGALPR
jgi:hypothetical protein